VTSFVAGAPCPGAALLRWLEPGRGGPIRPGTLQITRASSERVGEASRGWDIGPEVVEAPAEVLDEGVPADDHRRSSVTLQPSHRSEARLQTPVVGLERIVRVGLRAVKGRREQLTQDARVDPVPVGGDLCGRDPSPADRLGEQPPCGLSVPPWREEDVDDLTELVDGPE
jgi:hypothetical protein